MNYPLDRIVNMSISQTKYIQNTDIDYEEFFDEIVGVTRFKAKKAVNIKFSLRQDRYKYVATKPIHLSQRVFKFNSKTGWYDSSISVIPNKELLQNLLSFGDALIVRSPVSVVKELRSIVQNLNRMYK